MKRLIKFVALFFLFSSPIQAQWVKSTDGLYGGEVRDLDQNSLGHIYAAGYGGYSNLQIPDLHGSIWIPIWLMLMPSPSADRRYLPVLT